MLVNALLIIAIVGVAFYLIQRKIKSNQQKAENEGKVNDVQVDDKTYTLDMMIKFTKKRIDEITKVNLYDLGLSEEELKRRKDKKYELKKALKGCTYGDVNDKKYVKELIFDILSKEYGVDETNVSKAIPFDIPSLLTPQDKYDIIIYMYQKEFGYEAWNTIMKKYNLATLKFVDGDTKPCYVVTPEEISDIYEKENYTLTFQDKLMVVVQRIYQLYKGYSSIDELRDQNIDGISGGVSGLPESFLSQVAQTDANYLTKVMDHKVPRSCDSIWIMYHGVSIRTLDQLIKWDGKDEAIALLTYLVKGARIISLTGEQGCGKTTMLMAMIENIYETMNIRVQEVAFELHLRKIYPTRNILSFRETETIAGQEGLDVQKKTDGSVNIIGEVATDEVASWMIQAAQVASKFTLFTHHAKTFPDLITALRNSMLRTGVFNNELVAEKQVVSVLNFDIHLVKDFRGNRYIERVTECIPVEDFNNYTFDQDKEKTLEGKFEKFADNATRYFTKQTNKEIFTYRNIMEYQDGGYVLTNRITDANLRGMVTNMDDNDSESFREFVYKQWGIKLNDRGEIMK